MDATWMTTIFVLIDTTTRRVISVYTYPDKKHRSTKAQCFFMQLLQ
jgi:hypothetical protein